MSRDPKPSPPPLPATTSVPERLRLQAAKAFLFASLLEFAGAGFATAWLMRDWSALWHDKQFVESVYLSYGGMLIYAFGRWGAMLLLVLYLSAGTLLLAITATVFRASKRPGLLALLAAISLFVVPAGSLAGLHALRRLRGQTGHAIGD